jgi:hypothetical protein
LQVLILNGLWGLSVCKKVTRWGLVVLRELVGRFGGSGKNRADLMNQL